MLNHVLHRCTESARCVHGDQNKGRVAIRRVGKTFINVGCQDGIDDAIEPQFKNEWSGRVLVRRIGRHQEENRAGAHAAQ